MTSPFETRIGYTFRDASLLAQALTHPSTGDAENNQRLEFLGDSVLGAIVTRILFDMFPDEPEGALARRRAALISRDTLAQVARDIGLGEELRVGLSEVQNKGHENDSNLEDALEALIGALSMDGGLMAAATFISPRWSKMAQEVEVAPKDAKTALQEWAQARGLPVPNYKLLESTGPAHAPQFTIEVVVKDQTPIKATASSKRAAEQAAATVLLGKLEAGA